MKNNNIVDTPTVINDIVELLQNPNCKKMYETYEKTRDPTAILNSVEGTGLQVPTGQFLANQGGTVTILNPTSFLRLPADNTTDGSIPVVVKEAVAEVRDEHQLPESVVQKSRKRTIMTRSLSRQASQNLAEVKEEEDSDSDYIPEPVPKKSRGSAAPRMRSTAGRKPNSAKGDGLEHLSPDERAKVRMRRQKNKEAAARCRQKRVDLTNSLADEVEVQKAENDKLRQEIRRLKQEQDKLSRQLKAHKAYGCSFLAGPTTQQQHIYQAAPPSITVAVKSQPVIVEAANAPYTLSDPVVNHQPLTKPRRPQTLGLTQKMSADKVQIKQEEQLETPSKMIAPLLDVFTPTSIFGNIPTLSTPTCSVQQQLRGALDQDLMTPSDLTCSLTAL